MFGNVWVSSNRCHTFNGTACSHVLDACLPPLSVSLHPHLMGKKKDKENQVPGDPKKKRCRWNTESDALFIGQLTAEKAAENRTHNAGWHQAAFTACSRVLAGSEKKSGGAAKTADACVTRWGTVCPSFLPCSLLLIFCSSRPSIRSSRHSATSQVGDGMMKTSILWSRTLSGKQLSRCQRCRHGLFSPIR